MEGYKTQQLIPKYLGPNPAATYFPLTGQEREVRDMGKGACVFSCAVKRQKTNCIKIWAEDIRGKIHKVAQKKRHNHQCH